MPEKEDHRGIWLAAAGATLATVGTLVAWNLLSPEQQQALTKKIKAIPEGLRDQIHPERRVFDLSTSLDEVQEVLKNINGFARHTIPDSFQIGQEPIPWFPIQGTQILAKPGRHNEANLYAIQGVTVGTPPSDEDPNKPPNVSHPLLLIGTVGVEEQFAWERKLNKPATIDLYGIFRLADNPMLHFELYVVSTTIKSEIKDEFGFIRMGRYRPITTLDGLMYSKEMYGHFNDQPSGENI